MSAARFYTVHLPTEDTAPGAAALGRAVLVREGFNWTAFFFAPFWALAEGLWLAAIPLIAALAALIAVPAVLGLGPVWPAVLGLGYGVLVGLSANDWRRAGLTARGYRMVEVVAAPDRAGALIRYAEAAEERTPPDPMPARPTTAARPAGVLGPGFWT